MTGPGRPAPFLSGESGTILGPRRIGTARMVDAALDLRRGLRLEPWRLARAARSAPPAGGSSPSGSSARTAPG